MRDDLIDFPCSPDWLDYYHERGLTPRSSGRNRDIERLTKEVRELRKLLQELIENRPKREYQERQKQEKSLDSLKE